MTKKILITGGSGLIEFESVSYNKISKEVNRNPEVTLQEGLNQLISLFLKQRVK